MNPDRPSLARVAAIIMAAVLLAVTGCKGKQTSSGAGAFQTGIASWYGKPFDGRPTASGEIFDMQKLTAAHRTLALGAVVRVENLSNHQQVQVKINDRGPFVADRIIDLSFAAAQAISIAGIANVRLEIVSTPPKRGADVYTVQVGNFSDRMQADPPRQELLQKYGTARVIFRGRDQSWRILVGIYATEESANVVASELNQRYGPAFVVLMDEDN